MIEANDVVLRAAGIRKGFNGSSVLFDVNVQLRRGEVVLLRGDNGSGKTTLLNIFTGHLEPDRGTLEVSGKRGNAKVSFAGKGWTSVARRHFTPEGMARNGIVRTWQDVRLFAGQDLRNNVALGCPEQIGERPLAALFRPGRVREQEQRVLAESEKLLAELGLAGRESAGADVLSLGEAKRVGIARAVASGAAALFLDEPFAGLDDDGADRVLELLTELNRNRALALVIVEHAHSAWRLLNVVSRVWTLREGRVEAQAPSEVAQEPVFGGQEIREWLRSIAPNALEETRLSGGAVLWRATIRPGGDAAELRATNIVVQRGGYAVAGGSGGLSLSLRQGQIACLCAPNGWGKSTFLEAPAGVRPIAAGSITLGGAAISSLPPWRRSRAGLSLLRAREHSFTTLTVTEALRLSAASSRFPGLERLASRKIGSLSGGERQKVSLSCVLGSAGHGVLLLDEPFGALDRVSVDVCRKRLSDSGRPILIAVPGTPSRPERKI